MGKFVQIRWGYDASFATCGSWLFEYTQFDFIRNTVKFWIVLFLIFSGFESVFTSQIYYQGDSFVASSGYITCNA